jgi:hypothetical protein
VAHFRVSAGERLTGLANLEASFEELPLPAASEAAACEEHVVKA